MSVVYLITLLTHHCTFYRVTVLKDRITRKSRGVAFVFFLNKEDAKKCSTSLNGQEVNINLVQV